MAPLSGEVWIALALITAAGILSVLGRIASTIEDEQTGHDARVSAEKLRRHYAEQLAAQQAADSEVIEVDIVEDEPAAKAA
jgi:hypothetical protein